MKKLLIGLMALSAISAGAKTWTLDECISYAIDHNINVQSQRLNATQSELAVTDRKSVV